MNRNGPLYVALGDSTGVGVGAREGGYPDRLLRRLRFVHPEFTLRNHCVSGATSTGVVQSQLARVPVGPTVVTLCVGINDITRQVDPTVYAGNLERILDGVLEKAPGALVVCNVPEVSCAPVVPAFLRDGIRAIIDVYNHRVQALCKARNVVLVDAFVHSCEVVPNRPDFFSADGFHPSDAGYQYWADMLWPYVRDAVRPLVRAA